MIVCPNCGEENPEKFRLCGFCGTALAPALPPQEVRKTVTIVFSDLKGSTAMAEKLDSEAVREVMSRYFDEMRGALERHGGTIEKYIGDAIMAVFGLPRVHEDDALRAVRAAVEMRERLAALNEELDSRWGVTIGNRTGVNTGEVVAGDVTTGQRLVTGDTVNTAARLEQAAPTCEVLIGEATYRLVRHAVDVEPVEPLELKGKAERVPAYRLISAKEAESVERRHDSPLVGRARELALLADELAASARDGSCRLVTIIAQAGVGKSRLIEEFVHAAQADAHVLKGRCLAYGRGITFWPLVEIVRDAGAIRDDDTPEEARAKLLQVAGPGGEDAVARVASAVGLGETDYTLDEVFWGTRKLLELQAARQPLVVVFEDIHWAESAFLDLIEHLQKTSRAPLLLLCAARPDLLEHRPQWSELNGPVIELEPLSDEESERIVANLLGEAPFPDEVRNRIIASAEGNPLFVQQVLSMMIDDGLLRQEEGRWVPTGDLSDLAIPGTIQALLAARLDLLTPQERRVIEPASVIGLVFEEAAVAGLVPDVVRPELESHLVSMTQKQLVRPELDASDLDYRFHHILIRDAAYQGILKRARATMHERFANWAEGVNRDRDRQTQFDEILGYHLEQAYQYLSELGPLDEHGLELGSRASARLATAGRRAFARGDMAAAANLLRRAAGLLPERDPARLELLPDLAEVMTEIGEFAWGEIFLNEAMEAARDLKDAKLEAHAKLGRLLISRFGDEAAWGDEVVRETKQMMEVLEAAEDHAGLAKTYRLLCLAHGTACRFADFLAAGERDLYHATQAGDRRAQTRAVTARAIAANYGPEPTASAIALCEEALALAAGNRRSEGLVMSYFGELEAMQGNFRRARELCRTARSMLEDAGAGVQAHGVSSRAGPVELLAGDSAAAEELLRRDYEALFAMGEVYFASTIVALLAEAVYVQGRYDEALVYSNQAEELAPEDDTWTQAAWRSTRGKLLVRNEETHAAALALAQEAVDLLRPTDAPVWRANGLCDYAVVLQGAGRSADAERLLEEALSLYEHKGASVLAKRTRTHLSQLAARAAAAR